MKKKLNLSLLAVALIAGSTGVMAAPDANLTFNGTVSSSTCTLAAADAAKVLTIPTTTALGLYAAGSNVGFSASSSFNFSACPAGLSKVTSAYTYQGALIPNNTTAAVATGTATNVIFRAMQSSGVSLTSFVPADGTSNSSNQASITANSATVPITVGIQASNSAGNLVMPTGGSYSGVYLVAFTYS